MRTTILSAWAWLAISLLVIIWVPIMFMVHLFDGDPSSYHTGRWFRRLGSAMTRVNPAWKVVVSGHLPDNPRNPYVVVANHQSLADIPVVSRLPWDMKWVGKESLFHVPLIGWMMRVSDDIPVSRDDRRSRAKVFIEARKRLADRVSVMIMPEGTRSTDGRLRPFSDGAFKLAMKEALPILPIAVDGTFSALPKQSWKFESTSNIRVHVFDPIMPADWESNGTGMRDHVRSLIRSKLAVWRGITEEEVDNTPWPEPGKDS